MTVKKLIYIYCLNGRLCTDVLTIRQDWYPDLPGIFTGYVY